MQVQVTHPELLVGEPAIFTTEKHRHLFISGAGRNLLGAAPRVQQRPGNAPFPSTGTNDELAVINSLIERGNHNSAVQNVFC